MESLEPKYSIGDVVCFEHRGSLYHGVVEVVDGDSYGVVFEEACDDFHTLGSRCNKYHGYWIGVDNCDLYKESEESLNIEISFDDIFGEN